MWHHLVVLHSQYLDLLLSGKKQIECRLSSVRRAPFEAVSPGDMLWLKPPSKPVRAVAVAGKCSFRQLRNKNDLARFSNQHASMICAENAFFDKAEEWAKYLSLIWIETVVTISPMPIRKSDKRAWVVMSRAPWPGMRLGSRAT